MRTNRAAHRVALAVTSGAIFEHAVPCEVLGINRPDLTDPWYEFRVCGTQSATTVAAGFVTADACGMAELATADTVVVPGCASVHPDPPADLVEAGEPPTAPVPASPGFAPVPSCCGPTSM